MPKKFLVSHSILKFIRFLHPEIKRKIREGFAEIGQNPHVGKNLKDELKGLKSHHVGHRRIVYRLAEESINIVALGPRSTIYADTYRLIHKTKN